jgi:membrane-associated phospholipid phosphatase
MVASAGAPGDIFPSLHTAVPLFLTLYAFRHRHRLPFRFTWPVMAFFSSQIIVATMFLRWHYLADIFAGTFLAMVATLLMTPIAAWEARRRVRSATSPTFARPLPLRAIGNWLRRGG